MTGDDDRVIVACPRGHRFTCRRDDLGKRVRCPREGCGDRFVLEEQLRMDPLLCGNCGEPLPDDAVLCTQCGREVSTGRRYTTSTDATTAVAGPLSLGAYVRGVASIAGLLIITALSVFIAWCQAPGKPLIPPRNYWVIDLLGWRTTWIILSCVFGFFTVKAVYQFVRTGEVDLQELEEM
jgi:hypothetical protein